MSKRRAIVHEGVGRHNLGLTITAQVAGPDRIGRWGPMVSYLRLGLSAENSPYLSRFR